MPSWPEAGQSLRGSADKADEQRRQAASVSAALVMALVITFPFQVVVDEALIGLSSRSRVHPLRIADARCKAGNALRDRIRWMLAMGGSVEKRQERGNAERYGCLA
ncbi:hypothetical protein NCCP691_03050 [Noviherbaspirillum aridicola]|uniref:Uncharacterized protein n=1 Tax=Noviherbaspirillum aridicola TaxID=2849687 RepID=A0ABQ4PZP2_9BURK|nr:hypothetical protein NCCP691_03050 [Noviherbaspirillum aridicola]